MVLLVVSCGRPCVAGCGILRASLAVSVVVTCGRPSRVGRGILLPADGVGCGTLLATGRCWLWTPVVDQAVLVVGSCAGPVVIGCKILRVAGRAMLPSLRWSDFAFRS